MVAKLGNSDASFRLGNVTPTAVYLGGQEVWTDAPVALTLYYSPTVNNDWAELGNWWLDNGYTVAATALPTAADSVIAAGIISSNSGSAPTVLNFTIGGSANLAIAITVTGSATFNTFASNSGNLTGNATFNNFSQNFGTVTGNATFNASSQNFGTVTGAITDNR